MCVFFLRKLFKNLYIFFFQFFILNKKIPANQSCLFYNDSFPILSINCLLPYPALHLETILLYNFLKKGVISSLSTHACIPPKNVERNKLKLYQSENGLCVKNVRFFAESCFATWSSSIIFSVYSTQQVRQSLSSSGTAKTCRFD